jgi:hypothetical protein
MSLLFKYTGTYSTEDRKVRLDALRILDQKRLKVSRPREFNDPFEITPCTLCSTADELIETVQSNPGAVRTLFEILVKTEKYPRSFDDFLKELPTLIKNDHASFATLERQAQWKKDSAFIEYASNEIGILCFSMTNLCVQMWAYYAASHRGVTIGFDWGINPPLECFGDVVDYHETRFQLDRTRPPSDEVARKLALRKSVHWRHEEEFRFVFPLRALTVENDLLFLAFDPASVQEVIFGFSTSNDHKLELAQFIKDRSPLFDHVGLFQIELDPVDFKFQIKKSTILA